MSTWAMIALAVLIAVVAAGILIKRYTKKALTDMDGVSDMAIVRAREQDKVLRPGGKTVPDEAGAAESEK